MNRKVVLPVCAVADCRGPHYARTYCRRHYARWRRYGDPLKLKQKHRPRRGVRTTCAVPGCSAPHRARGLCHRHYRNRR